MKVSIGMIRPYWPQYDTAEIAQILRCTEAEVYNARANDKGSTEPAPSKFTVQRSKVCINCGLSFLYISRAGSIGSKRCARCHRQHQIVSRAKAILRRQ